MLIGLLSAALISQPTQPLQANLQANLPSPPSLPLKHSTGPCSRPIRPSGVASYYADYFHNRQTASGTTFSNHSNQAAHRTLPFGTQVCVQANNKSTVVVITDRGPFVGNRIIDLSQHSFSQLAPLSSGLVRVQLRY